MLKYQENTRNFEIQPMIQHLNIYLSLLRRRRRDFLYIVGTIRFSCSGCATAVAVSSPHSPPPVPSSIDLRGELPEVTPGNQVPCSPTLKWYLNF